MIPPAVTEARAKQLPHHRTPEFMNLIKSIHEDLKYIFCTKNPVYSISSSGTGAMEASVASLLSPGDLSICIDAGKFGERWVELCTHYGVEVIKLEAERGSAIEPQRVADALKKYPQAKAVYTQLTETSTGVTNDIEAIGKIVKGSDAAFVVDAISGMAVEEFWTDKWHVDITVLGSQKGLMLPPGLSFVSVSDKAWNHIERAKCPCYYLDLRRYRKGHDAGEHPFTPVIGLYIQLEQALRMIREETMEGLWKRHAWLAKATRSAIEALGLTLFAKHPSNALTAVKVPDGIEGGKLVKMMRDDYGVTIAGGQSELKGKIFRIAHMGYVDRFDIIAGISALEMTLKQLGYSFEPGRGVQAAENLLQETPA